MIRGKPFEKGNKAAAGHGAPKLVAEFRQRCRDAVDEHVIKAWVSEVETLGDNWPKCSEMLAAYGYGKPVQAVELTGTLTAMATEQLIAQLPEALAVLEGKK